MLVIRDRGHLPHRETSGAIYFVTFRLHDSLPQSLLRKIELERDDIVATAQSLGRELSPNEAQRLADLATKKIERFLDTGAGACYLANPLVARVVKEAIRKFEGARYRCYAWCVMPNHVHAILRPLATRRLSEILHTWKSYSANRANRILERSGRFWQREYFDRIIRDDESFHRIVKYVLGNPRKAGLRDWQWVSSPPAGDGR
jgi:REP element-mobilizing transposase RayT